MRRTARPRGRFAACALAIFLVTGFGLPVVPANAASVPDGRDVSFTGGNGLVLHGTVIAPAALRADTPGVVLVGGAGAGPRELYLYEARAFAAAGITAFVYDKRTADYSRYHRDFSLLADDALGAVELLRHTPGVRADEVGLWALSEGGWVAPLAASRSRDAAFLITVGAPGFTPLRTQTWYLANLLRHRGVGGPLADLVAGPAARLVGETGLFPEAGYDPLPALRGLRIPVLASWGRDDVEVPPAESAAVLRNALVGAPSVTIRFLDGMSHNGRVTTDGFDRVGAAPGPGLPRGEFAPGYFATMTTWLNQVATGHPPAAAEDTPPTQAAPSVDPGTGWWTSAASQLTLLAVLVLAFAGYLLYSFLGRRGPIPPAGRLLALSGLTSTIATVGYLVLIFATDASMIGPIVLGRPVVWLVLQLLALVTVALLAVTAVKAVRGHGVRGQAGLRVVLGAGLLWVAFAITWDLFSW